MPQRLFGPLRTAVALSAGTASPFSNIGARFVRHRKGPLAAARVYGSMESQNTPHPYDRRWLASVIATSIAIAINHWFVLGRGAFALAAALVLLAIGVSAWLRRSQRPVAIAAFSLVNAWIVIGFGLMKGFWATVLKLFVATTLAQISIVFPKPAVGPTTQELSGVLMFLASLFVAHYAFETIATKNDTVRAWRPTIASGALIALILSVVAYAATIATRGGNRRTAW
jgi:hypothetical protein